MWFEQWTNVALSNNAVLKPQAYIYEVFVPLIITVLFFLTGKK
jgi:hypothetical protein